MHSEAWKNAHNIVCMYVYQFDPNKLALYFTTNIIPTNFNTLDKFLFLFKNTQGTISYESHPHFTMGVPPQSQIVPIYSHKTPTPLDQYYCYIPLR